MYRPLKNTDLPFWFVALSICLVITTYSLLFGKYHPYHIDHAWTASIDYHTYIHGFRGDRVFAAGFGRSSLFGVTHAYVYGSLAQLFGWSASSLRLFSFFFVVCAALLWMLSLYRLTRSGFIAFGSALCMVLFDPFVFASQLARPEALNLFFIALAVWLSVREKYYLGCIVAGLAFESHIMGFTAYLYVFAVFMINRSYTSRRNWLILVAGAVTGLAYYLCLHYAYLDAVIVAVQQGLGTTPGRFSNFLIHYYFDKRYYQHIPELLVLIALLRFVFLSKKYRIKIIRFALTGILLIILLSMIAARGNASYIAYFYPFVVVLLIGYLHTLKHKKLWLMMSLLYFLPQYGYRLYETWGYSDTEYIRRVHNSLEKNDLLDQVIFGYPHHWFAVNADTNNQFYADLNPKASIEGRRFVWIRDSNLRKHLNIQNKITELESKRDVQCTMALLDTWQYTKHIVRFEQYDCRSKE